MCKCVRIKGGVFLELPALLSLDQFLNMALKAVC